VELVSVLRIGGIASGMDTEQIVKDLMRVERMRADKFYRQRQVIGWQKEQYRSVINSIRSFRDNYFNTLKPETNLLSSSSLNRMSVSSDNPSIVTVTANASAQSGQTVFQAIQSATAAKAQGTGVTTLKSSEAIGDITVTEGKNTISVTLNGQTKNITLDPHIAYNTLSDLQSELQEKLDAAFGTGKIAVTQQNGRLEFGPHPDSDTKASDIISLASSTYYDPEGVIDPQDILAVMNIKSSSSNRLSLSDTMETVSDKLRNGPFTFDANDQFNLVINGKDITVNKSDTLQTVISRINNSGAGVRAAYSSFGDTFTITSTATGSGFIETNDGGSFFSASWHCYSR
jgi:flagellar hook-associated protein 2